MYFTIENDEEKSRADSQLAISESVEALHCDVMRMNENVSAHNVVSYLAMLIPQCIFLSPGHNMTSLALRVTMYVKVSGAYPNTRNRQQFGYEV